METPAPRFNPQIVCVTPLRFGDTGDDTTYIRSCTPCTPCSPCYPDT